MIYSKIHYLLAAVILKAFSSGRIARNLYRKIGNKLGQSNHSSLSEIEVSRGLWISKLPFDYSLDLSENGSVLDLGTGWTHFYAIILRLFYKTPIILFDIQDNRQFGAFTKRIAKLLTQFTPLLNLKVGKNQQEVLDILKRLSNVISFDDLYSKFYMTYIIQPDGSLGIFRPSSFDFIYSVDVFEHIERNSVEKEIKEIYRILKPGGVTAHQIGLDDHLTHYAVGMPSKNYLRYPTKEWKLFFENRLQYINRVQLPEFYYYFKTAGFIEVKSDIEYDDSLLKKISPSVEFRKFSDSDLKAIRGSLVFRKPG